MDCEAQHILKGLRGGLIYLEEEKKYHEKLSQLTGYYDDQTYWADQLIHAIKKAISFVEERWGTRSNQK